MHSLYVMSVQCWPSSENKAEKRMLPSGLCGKFSIHLIHLKKQNKPQYIYKGLHA